MPQSVDTQTRAQVVKEWLSGDTRNEIASNNEIGAGTVSNIINEWKKGLHGTEFDSIRELSVFLKRGGITLNDLAPLVRLNNYITNLGGDFGQIESLITNIATSQYPQKLIDIANQIAQLSASESIPLDEVADHIKRKQEEKQELEKEIEKAREILKQTHINIQTVKEYKRSEDELQNCGLSMNDTNNIVSILKKFKKMRFDPRNIVLEISCVRSLRQQEHQLKNSCKMLELHASRYKEIFPLCEQLLQLGIGFAELTAFHAAVMKRSNLENLPISTAAYRVMEDIESCNKLSGMKEQLIKVGNQLFLVNEILGCKNAAINAMMKLQAYGVTDNEILDVHEFLNRAGEQRVVQLTHFP